MRFSRTKTQRTVRARGVKAEIREGDGVRRVPLQLFARNKAMQVGLALDQKGACAYTPPLNGA